MRTTSYKQKKQDFLPKNRFLSSIQNKAPIDSPLTISSFNFNDLSVFPTGTNRLNQSALSKIKIANFYSLPQHQPHEKNKSKSPSTEDQDLSASATSFAATTRGVDITVEVADGQSSSDYPDGLRWTQTIITNTEKGGPLLSTPVEYVDPTPNDDTKPFYWTDAEEAASPGKFRDAPSRNPRAEGTINWDAVLSLNGVNGKSVERFDSISYGFSVDSKGTVTTRGPGSSLAVGSHLATLRSGFPDWTFK